MQVISANGDQNGLHKSKKKKKNKKRSKSSHSEKSDSEMGQSDGKNKVKTDEWVSDEEMQSQTNGKSHRSSEGSQKK